MFRFRLKKALKKSYHNARPTRRFQGYLWARLADELPPLRTGEKFGMGLRKVAYSLAVAVPFFTFGTGAFAYVSPTVTEGTTLYSVKQQLEDFEGSFAHSHEAQAAFHLKMYGRRLREAEYLKTDVQRFDLLLNAASVEQTESTTVITRDLSGTALHPDYERRLQVLDERYEVLRRGGEIKQGRQLPFRGPAREPSNISISD